MTRAVEVSYYRFIETVIYVVLMNSRIEVLCEYIILQLKSTETFFTLVTTEMLKEKTIRIIH